MVDRAKLLFCLTVCILIVAISACSGGTAGSDAEPVEVVFDASLDAVVGGTRLAPHDSQWDGYGEAVDVYDHILVIGAPEWNHFGPGSAYVYRQSDGAWREELQLVASDKDEFIAHANGEEGQRFGTSVAVQDDVIAVGAPGNMGSSSFGYEGAVYIYEYNGETWAETEKLTPSQAGQVTEQEGPDWLNYSRMRPMRFGSLLDMNGTTLAVGGDASGLIYVYQHGEAGWQEQDRITIPAQSGRDYYLTSISLFKNTLAINALYIPAQPEESALMTGKVVMYVYERSGTSWKEVFRYAPDDGKVDYLFFRELTVGASTALGGNSESANLLIFGMPGFPDWTDYPDIGQLWSDPILPFPGSNHQTGKVRVFAKGTDGRWSHQAVLKPIGWDAPPGPGYLFTHRPTPGLTDGEVFDQEADLASVVFPGHVLSERPEVSFFGASVTLDGGQLAITSGFANSAYLFELQDGEWVYRFRFRPVNEKMEMWEDYSQSVALSGHALLLGTPGEFGNSAYVFDICTPGMLDCE